MCPHFAMLLLLLPPKGRMPLPLAAVNAVDLLQLAINCRCTATAEAAFHHIPAQLDASAAHSLLLTAAVRHGAQVARRLVEVRAVRQHLDAPTLITFLKLLLSREDYPRRDVGAITLLLRDHPAVAQQMGADDVVEVLHVAAASRTCHFAQHLFELPNVQQLGFDVVLQMLSAAVDALHHHQITKLSHSIHAVDALDEYGAMRVSGLPAAEQLAIGDVAQRLQAAAEAGDIRMVRVLLHLPAAQQLSDGDVTLVLRAAENSGDDSVWRMCSVLMC
jgi:hypothetical protein